MQWIVKAQNVIASSCGRYRISKNGRTFYCFLTDGTGRIQKPLHKGTRKACIEAAVRHQNPYAAKLKAASQRGLMSLDQFRAAIA